MALRDHLRGFPDLPPLWLLGTMAASTLLGRTGIGASGGWAHTAGGVLIALGLALIGWAALWFRRKRTPIEPHHAPTALIVEGPYRLGRNPIYLALVLIAVGYGLRQPSVLALLPPPALWWVLDRRFARIEEDRLRAAFGAAAEPFLRGTRRWL